MRVVYQWILLFTFVLCVGWLCGRQVSAAERDEQVSVTVSSQISIVFEENGSTSVSDFTIANDSVVPIHITNVAVTMCNGWELVNGNKSIPADRKQLALSFQGQYLKAGDNLLQLTIPENEVRSPELEVRRGAFCNSAPSQKAMVLSIEYALGKKAFGLTLASTEEAVERLSVYNGERVKLPVPERMKYNFLGWEDEEGNRYQEEFLMPMREVTLTAKWQWTDAYAIYTKEDQTLRFVRSPEPIVAGVYWEGKKIQEVYSGVEEKGFITGQKPPWFQYAEMKRVEVLDWIQPALTAYWFFGMQNVEYLDLRKLEMSQVTNMGGMFSATGMAVTEKVTVLGLEDWDVSNVKNFTAAFRQFGRYAKVFEMGDISGWNTSAGENMMQMFLAAFQNANVTVDCSKWNVENVTSRKQFKEMAGGIIIEPIW